MVMGTPDYMAPEQARGDRVDARADVYAVGAILYRAVTGKKPFDGLDPMATLTAALVQEPPRPTSVAPEIPLELEMVIQRAMAKNPPDRYGTMEELNAALAPFDRRSGAGKPESERGPVDGTANTIPAPPQVGTSGTALEQGGRLLRLARPALVAFSALGFVWLVGNVTVAVSAFIRLTRGAELTAAETVMVPIGVFAAAVTPLVLWFRHLARDVWPNTPRSVEIGARVRRTVLASACAYGLTALFVQVFEAVVNRNGAGVARPGWALTTFQVALVIGAVAWLAARPKPRAGESPVAARH
jgi:serine/threonine-protein kinase